MSDESHSNLMFIDDSARWYVAHGDETVGPLKPSEILERIERGELSWVSFIFKKGEKSFKRICDVDVFKSAVPIQPSTEIIDQINSGKKPDPTPKRSVNPKGWFLYYNQAQHGPFHADEVKRYLLIGKIHGRVHAWSDGMSGWSRLMDIDAFSAILPEEKEKTPKAVEEMRELPRKPLVARVLASQGDALAVGLCRDISVGGMQVLTDSIPGRVGERVQLNISPSESGAIEPFVAKGVIVRILDDGRGFSFRFEELDEKSRSAIERFVKSLEQSS